MSIISISNVQDLGNLKLKASGIFYDVSIKNFSYIEKKCREFVKNKDKGKYGLTFISKDNPRHKTHYLIEKTIKRKSTKKSK